MLAVASVWKKKRDELGVKRKSLSEQYAEHPLELHLALEIKTIDDEIAVCTENLVQERRSSRPVSPAKKVSPPDE
jgi:hypothetical protein